jgi:25S rRNA (adenine2142-N1)-methyltransferase
MNTVGFEVVKSRYKQGGKVGYWLFRWRESTGMDAKSAKKFAQKTVINEGPKRNNFAILLREDGPTHTGS